MTVQTPTAADRPAAPEGSDATPQRSRNWAAALSVRNIGSVYVLIVIIIVFSIWVPHTFPTWATVQQVLSSYAITAMAALALIVPLSARTFDLSFAYVMSLSGCVTAHFMVSNDLGIVPSILLGLAAALVVGVINGVVVVVLKIDSFIGTLATGSLVQAFITYFTNDTTINDPKLGGTFAKIGQGSIGGITYPVFYALGLAIILWLFMEYASTGRRLYATGFNTEAARLANIRVDRLRFCALLTSALISGFAGIVLASSLSSGSPSSGTGYLLPSFAAVFVGATQLKNGRFNAWGTVLAILMLGTGTIGLQLATPSPWAPAMFTGVVLLVALGATGFKRRSLREGRASGLLSRLRRQPSSA